MKIRIILLAVLSAVIAMPSSAQRSNKANAVELSFNYQKQSGAGSNQWAVWIENSEGKVVRTLTVTSFTSKGRGGRRGYTFRPTCVPTWVKNAKAEEMSDDQIDAVTGATPTHPKRAVSRPTPGISRMPTARRCLPVITRYALRQLSILTASCSTAVHSQPRTRPVKSNSPQP